MKSGALILGIIVSVVLLVAASVLYVMAGSGNAQQYRASVDLVRQIQQLSSNWSIEVARVKADPLGDFDALAAFIPRMARLKEGLSDAARPSGEYEERSNVPHHTPAARHGSKPARLRIRVAGVSPERAVTRAQ